MERSERQGPPAGPPGSEHRIRPNGLTVPRPERFNPDHPGYDQAMAAHERAVAAGVGGYREPTTGLFVMTASYLHERGWCCDRGCRHCPYVAQVE